MGCGDCGSGESGASHLGVYGSGLMDLVRGNKRAILVLLPKNGSCGRFGKIRIVEPQALICESITRPPLSSLCLWHVGELGLDIGCRNVGSIVAQSFAKACPIRFLYHFFI